MPVLLLLLLLYFLSLYYYYRVGECTDDVYMWACVWWSSGDTVELGLSCHLYRAQESHSGVT